MSVMCRYCDVRPLSDPELFSRGLSVLPWEECREQPMLFMQLVFRAINEEGISLQRGAELLQVPITDIEKYCGLMEV